ncbi:hypothetical protein DFH06DRAFT_1348128 [Mycena polygramma]|nr:hypothetical protein DFH06DRAFT_1348128 [Mycena polygramma]
MRSSVIQSLSAISIFAACVHGSRAQIRDDTQSITFTLAPTPTLTNSAVNAAYSVYAEKCGTDLDTIAYADLPAYISQGNSADTTIDDPDYQNYLDSNADDWQQAQQVCTSALNDFENVVVTTTSAVSSSSSASSSSSSSSQSKSTASAKSSSSGKGGSSSAARSSATGKSSSGSAASTAAQAKPSAGRVVRPAWLLAVITLGAVFVGQIVCV